MNLTIITFGSEGCTRPLVGLCRGLMDAGHSVCLLADGSTLGTAHSQCVDSTALVGDMKAAVGPNGALFSVLNDGKGVAKLGKGIIDIVNQNLVAWMKALIERAANSDAILFSGMTTYVGLSVAEHLRIPAIGLGLWPISPTTAFPSPFVSPLPLPGCLNRVSHSAINALSWRINRKGINAARQKVCNQAIRRRAWSDYPMLYGISRHLVSTPEDWPDSARICGAWTVNAEFWTPPDALVEFLSSGEPPVYVGFGSMGGWKQSTLLTTIIRALDGKRALFFPGWSGVDPRSLPSNFHVLDDTPHSWLFPQMAMAIHHGGAGTTHAAARAGIPSIVIPFGADQYFWASRLASTGLAPKYLSQRELTWKSLSTMIEFCRTHEAIARAKKVSELMASEDGVAFAVTCIEKYVGTRKMPHPSEMYTSRASAGAFERNQHLGIAPQNYE